MKQGYHNALPIHLLTIYDQLMHNYSLSAILIKPSLQSNMVQYSDNKKKQTKDDDQNERIAGVKRSN